MLGRLVQQFANSVDIHAKFPNEFGAPSAVAHGTGTSRADRPAGGGGPAQRRASAEPDPVAGGLRRRCPAADPEAGPSHSAHWKLVASFGSPVPV